jgi:hypothetical protein
MNGTKKENLFARLASQQHARASQEEGEAAGGTSPEDTPPSPAPADPPAKNHPARTKPETAKGKRDNPDYCQANAYVPKTLRRAVERALLDVEGLDYSTLVTDLLRKWVKSRGVAE